MYVFLVLLVAAGLGLVPGSIAKQKGYSFGLWWFYGFMIFIVAIIHVALIKDKNAPTQANSNGSMSKADELIKYKELLDQGLLTEEEFNQKNNSY